MPTKVSGQKLVARFGWSCAQERLNDKRMKQSDFDELRKCIEQNSTWPDEILLTLCFPNLIRGLRAFAEKLRWSQVGLMPVNMWDYGVVEDFLKQHQGLSSSCATKIGIMICDNEDGSVDVLCDSTIIRSENKYGIALDPVLPVMIHHRVVIAQLK